MLSFPTNIFFKDSQRIASIYGIFSWRNSRNYTSFRNRRIIGNNESFQNGWAATYPNIFFQFEFFFGVWMRLLSLYILWESISIIRISHDRSDCPSMIISLLQIIVVFPFMVTFFPTESFTSFPILNLK